MADKKIPAEQPPHAASDAASEPPSPKTDAVADALPKAVAGTASELSSLEPGVVANALSEALPVPDIMFGGTVLHLVVMLHAFGIRAITTSFLKRSHNIGPLSALWRAELLFAATVLALLSLHLLEVMFWSAALILGNIVPDWSKAAYFAANCYTALGEPFNLPHAWRIVPPIIAISGIFTFAWTASVLVNFVERYNELRSGIIAREQERKTNRQQTS